MKRVIVIGCPGSGKSTFSRALHQKTGIPLVHLDMLYWNPDRTTVDDAVFLERLTNVLQTGSWIIDGNYGNTLECRIQACNTVFFLDYPLEVCLAGIESRRGKPRPDMPWIENDLPDRAFLELIQNYGTQNRPTVMALLSQYGEKEIHIFHSREEASRFLETV